MSATIMAGELAIAVAYTKTDIYSAIMDGRTGRGFSLIVDGQEADIIREAMRRYCEEPKPASPINLKMRPMSEAPLNKQLLVILVSGEFALISLSSERVKTGWAQTPGVQNFYEVSELIRAAEIVAAITPEGYEYEAYDHYDRATDGAWICRTVWFWRLAPPVEYEYVTDGELKACDSRNEEFIFDKGRFRRFIECGPGEYPKQLHYRRVEVKR